jgi:hypothetical protein
MFLVIYSSYSDGDVKSKIIGKTKSIDEAKDICLSGALQFLKDFRSNRLTNHVLENYPEEYLTALTKIQEIIDNPPNNRYIDFIDIHHFHENIFLTWSEDISISNPWYIEFQKMRKKQQDFISEMFIPGLSSKINNWSGMVVKEKDHLNQYKISTESKYYGWDIHQI